MRETEEQLDGGKYLLKPWKEFVREARRTNGYSLFDLIHAYVYARWIYLYIGFGAGKYPIARWYLKFRQLTDPNREGALRKRGAYAVSREAAPAGNGLAQTYHGKVVPLQAARELVSIKEDIRLPDLEHIIPFEKARDLIMLNPTHLAVLDCPCRAARETPCLPVDVCLIVGEPFASLVLEKHPAHSRRINVQEACEILEAEDERGHVHHAFFKDAMLGRFYAICNCCACCCGAIRAQRGGTPMLISSGYVCQVQNDLCLGCGICEPFCQFDALSLMDGGIRVDEEACMGCGVCLSKCSNEALSLRRAEERGQPLEMHVLMTDLHD